MKKSLFIALALLLTTACSDSGGDGAGSPPPEKIVGLWTEENVFNTLNKDNLTCADFQGLKNMDDKGNTVIELSISRIEKNGAVSEASSISKTVGLIYARLGTVNAAGVLTLTGEAQKAMNEELQAIKEMGGQVSIVNKFVSEDDGNKLVLSVNATVSIQGQKIDIPEQKSTAVRVTQEQVDAAVTLGQSCL